MDGAVSRNGQNLAERHILGNKTVTLERKNASKMSATENDCGVQVASGPSTNLAQLASFPPTFHTSRNASNVPALFNKSGFVVGRSLKEDGTRPLCKLLREHFIKNDEDILEARHRETVVLASVS